MEGNTSDVKETKQISVDISMKSVGKWLPIIAIIIIMILSMHIRLVGFYDNNWPYLRNIDSFYFMREMGEIVDNNGVLPSHDVLRFAPDGFERNVPSLYSYIGAYSYSFFKMFMPDMELWQFLIWFPALLGSLVAIPAYFIGSHLLNKKAGVLTAIFMVFAIPFLSRSLGGDPDSDAIVMLLLLASIAGFLITYKNLNKGKLLAWKNIIYPAITGVILGLFALTWVGYWFAFVLIIGFIVLKFIFDFIMTKKHDLGHLKNVWYKNKTLIFAFVVLLIAFYVITLPVFGAKFAANPFTAAFGSIGETEKIKGEVEEFPNVFVSVAEMQSGGDLRDVAIRAGSIDIASQASGIPMALIILISPFLLTIGCFVFLFYAYWKRREHFDTLLIMLIWFVGFLVASTVAVRFTIFISPVYAICSAIFLAKLWDVLIKKE
ncbi:MAG: STT3 domain-containing protein [Candidatus Aenigmatarchaeota archaeon]